MSRSRRPLREARCLKQRSESHRQPRLKSLGEGQKLGVTPHIRRTLRDAFAAERSLRNPSLDRIVIVSNFERRKTLVANGAGLVSPASTAFPATQFVVRIVSRHP